MTPRFNTIGCELSRQSSPNQSFVILVDLRRRNCVALQEWAESIHRRIVPGDFPEEISALLGIISKTPISGWNRLCNLQDIYLAITRPPPYNGSDDQAWFWEPLVIGGDNELRVAILSDQKITDQIPGDWAIDGIATDMDTASIDSAVQEAPRLALALAVLNMPLYSYLISVDATSEGANYLQDWAGQTKVMIDTHAGPIMTATARHYVLERQTPEQLRRAHSDCARMLYQPLVRRTTQVREELLKHFIGAGLDEYALETAANLCFEYKERDRPAAVLHLLKQIGPLRQDLPDWVQLIPAWAYLQLGKLGQARLFLDRAEPSGSLDVAWKHGLRAEYFKSEGSSFSKEKSLQEIEAAIEACRAAVPDANNPADLIERRLRAYRQDHARILQFLFYKKEEAAAEYEALINEWSNQPEAVIDLAVVKRNYSECLRSLSTGPDDPKIQKAREILQEAEQLVKDRPELPILAEILYEKAKAAEMAGKLTELPGMLDDCRRAANQSQHYMVRAIVDSKIFWTLESFSSARWEQVSSNLSSFPQHGWAVRTLVNGRLQAARRLVMSENYVQALIQLEAARKELERNPSFNMGGDKFRIAATYAGLEVIVAHRQQTGFWPEFKSKYDWADEWLKGRNVETYEAIWSEVK